MCEGVCCSTGPDSKDACICTFCANTLVLEQFEDKCMNTKCACAKTDRQIESVKPRIQSSEVITQLQGMKGHSLLSLPCFTCQTINKLNQFKTCRHMPHRRLDRRSFTVTNHTCAKTVPSYVLHLDVQLITTISLCLEPKQAADHLHSSGERSCGYSGRGIRCRTVETQFKTNVLMNNVLQTV